jgi:hypothetical protein
MAASPCLFGHAIYLAAQLLIARVEVSHKQWILFANARSPADRAKSGHLQAIIG